MAVEITVGSPLPLNTQTIEVLREALATCATDCEVWFYGMHEQKAVRCVLRTPKPPLELTVILPFLPESGRKFVSVLAGMFAVWLREVSGYSKPGVHQPDGTWSNV